MVGRRPFKKKSGDAELLGSFDKIREAAAPEGASAENGTGRSVGAGIGGLADSGNAEEAERFFSVFRQGGPPKPAAPSHKGGPADIRSPGGAQGREVRDSVHGPDGVVVEFGQEAAPGPAAPTPAASGPAAPAALEARIGPAERQAPAVPEETEFGEPSCATPVDIGWNPEPTPSNDDFASSAHDDAVRRPEADTGSVGDQTAAAESGGGASHDGHPGGEEHRRILVERIRKENLSLAATLEKAKEWNWSTGRLSLTFGFEYEASVAKNEAETIRRAASAVGLPPFSLDVKTVDEGKRPAGVEESPRVELVRRVFRGQVMKG